MNVKANSAPADMMPESKVPSALPTWPSLVPDVTVCTMSSVLRHTTVDPTGIVTSRGA